MKQIKVIGIGAGNPEYLTILAINAMKATDVFFLLEKGDSKSTLLDFRHEILERYVETKDYRIIDAQSPEWDRNSATYDATITDLNRDKQSVFEHLIAEGLKDGETGAFLVWGDPTLYDSTIRILNTIAETGRHDFDFEVIPGISAAQALVARHKTTLNQISGAVQITPGRLLADGLPADADSVIVMLDAKNQYTRYVDEDIDIYWGAYLGTPDEILISGKLKDVAEEIEQTRAEAREKHNWIMDTYLLRWERESKEK